MTESRSHGGNDTLKYGELTDSILGTFYEVYNELGFGFLESVYENALVMALREKGLLVSQQVPIPVWFRGKIVGNFTADLVVDEIVLLELKAARSIDEAHKSQLLNYLKATRIEVGFLLNFGHAPEFKRMAFENSRKKPRAVDKRALSVLFSNDEMD